MSLRFPKIRHPLLFNANSFNSLFFTIIVTRLNGLNDAGIFTYCFATACVLYNIAVYEGRAFQVTDITGKNTDMDYIYHRIMTCIIMIKKAKKQPLEILGMFLWKKIFIVMK